MGKRPIQKHSPAARFVSLILLAALAVLLLPLFSFLFLFLLALLLALLSACLSFCSALFAGLLVFLRACGFALLLAGLFLLTRPDAVHANNCYPCQYQGHQCSRSHLYAPPLNRSGPSGIYGHRTTGLVRYCKVM